MADIGTIFLDDGGVMNDNELRAPQWRRLVGEFFVPRLGGTRAEWAEANGVVFGGLWESVMAGPVGGQSVLEWWNGYQNRWVREMAGNVGVTPPATDAECIKLAREASDFVIRNVKSDFPGAADTVKRLKDGYELFTASGTISWELDGYLRDMGISDLFTRRYGPDLIDQAKTHIDFYRRIFEDSGVDPHEALLVDDSERHLDMAASLGATTVLVSGAPAASSAHRVIPSITALPELLADL